MKTCKWSVIAMAMCTTPALATITITQGDSQVVHAGNSLNFDEAGGPGVGVVGAGDWSSSHGITSMGAGDSLSQLENNTTNPGFGWLGDENVFKGGFGVFMNFDSDLTDMSFQGWDNGGPASFFGGGAKVIVFNDGVELTSLFLENPVFFDGDAGTWFNITADGGDVFDDVQFFGFAMAGPVSYVDNMTWNAVPTPGAFALLGLGGALAARRRR